jgi:hypothetical protein
VRRRDRTTPLDSTSRRPTSGTRLIGRLTPAAGRSRRPRTITPVGTSTDWDSLWAVPAYLDYVQPALTDDAVAEAEAQLGVRLPRAYLQMLTVQNGGSVRATWPDSPHRRVDGIGPELPNLTHEPWWRRDDAEDDMWVPADPELLVSFDGEGHWDLCFDYRACGPTGEPAVTYVDSELEEDTRLTDSFVDFLDGLVDEVERDAIRVYGPVSPEEFTTVLGRAIDRDFVDVGDWNNGYRVFRARVGESASWVWVSPNRVPAGFRRQGERLLTTDETALRLPADPDCSLLMTSTSDVDAIVRQAALATAFDVRG